MGHFFGTQICQWLVVTGRMHINHLELLAVPKAGHEDSEEEDNSHIFGRRDRHVLPQQGGGGGTRSVPLNRLTLDILTFCQDHGIFLIPTYLPGVANLSVDALSRGQESKEWLLNLQVVNRMHIWTSSHHTSPLTFQYISPNTGRTGEMRDQCSGSEVEFQEEVCVFTSSTDSI